MSSTIESVSSYKTSYPTSIESIPSSYYEEATEQGSLIDFHYVTYESFSYEEKSQTLNKRAVVYLPYGYDEKKPYEILYYMHGGWSDETTTLGYEGHPNTFKNVIDHMIMDKVIKPLIIVCPTYNNTSENDSSDFSLALRLTRNYHNELINDLIPAVESTYRTFASTADETGLKASRSHRSFGGFSMGSVTTWRTFEYAMPYFRNYFPMSCGTSLDDEEIWKGAEGFNKNDYFVFVMTGTDDFAYSYDSRRTSRMGQSSYFVNAADDPNGNYLYLVKNGYSHNDIAATEYTYNAMKFFFKA